MFSFENKRGNEKRGFHITHKKGTKEREKETKLFRLTSELKKKGINIGCSKCSENKRCQDKYAPLIIGNGSGKAFLNYHLKNKTNYSCCQVLLETMKRLDYLYQEREDIREIYKKIKTQPIF